MKFGVVVFPGSNCDHDTYHVISKVIGQPVDFIWHKQESVEGFDAILLPGGFSYGDYLRTGAMAAHSPIMRDVVAKAKAGTPVLGICNGFQILCEAGLLPGVLQRNASLKFICKDVYLKVENVKTMYTNRYKPGQIAQMICAHGDGNYFADKATLDRLEGEGRVVFRYADQQSRITPEANANGAQRNIAGICDASGRILGMMPHPENAAEAALGTTDGRILFESIVAAMASA